MLFEPGGEALFGEWRKRRLASDTENFLGCQPGGRKG
jgi:hypothetical protein